MKYGAFVSLFLLAGCAQTQTEQSVLLEAYPADEFVVESIAPVSAIEPVAPAAVDSSTPVVLQPVQPVVSVQIGESVIEPEPQQPVPVPVVQEPQAAAPMSQSATQQVQPVSVPAPAPVQQPVVEQVGNQTMIALPPQQIYISDIPDTVYQQTFLGATLQQPMQQPVQQVVDHVVTLQYPGRQDLLVQCLASDIACLTAYEQQGYRQVRYLPQFAGYQEVLAPSDYPTGSQWQHQHNIPRW